MGTTQWWGTLFVHACVQEAGKGGRWPPGITYQLLAVRAQSRGSVKLEAADVTQRPAIDLAYLSDSSGARPGAPLVPLFEFTVSSVHSG